VAAAPIGDPEHTVRRHWDTALVLTRVDPGALLAPDTNPTATGAAREILPADQSAADPAALAAVFAAAADHLPHTPPASLGRPVQVAVEIWRNGYEVPIAVPTAAWAGWCFLATTGTPLEEDCGALAFHDPRAGAALTTMPGLPWGRDFTVHARPGNLVIAPGWLPMSVIPLAPGHAVMVAVAAPRGPGVPSPMSKEDTPCPTSSRTRPARS
jgi:hypothetical protein